MEEEVEDIEVVSFRGLGRGMGFEKAESISALDDEEVCKAIAGRCYAILSLLGLESEEDYSGLLERVNEALPDEIPWIGDLESAVDALIAEYEDALEEE